MQEQSPAISDETPARPLPAVFRIAPGAAVLLAVVSAVLPVASLALALGALFFVLYAFRRDLLLRVVLVVLLFQNLAYRQLLGVNEQLAGAVKHADDILIVFFALALGAETFVPVARLSRLPRWKTFGLLAGVCLLSALVNRLDARQTAIGSYVLLKSFVWFFLAATLALDERGYRALHRFLMMVLGAVLAFGFVQFLTGDLTYDLLGLPKDYRFGMLRLRSIFVHPVYLAEAMALLAVLSVSAYIHFRNPVYLLAAVGAAVAVGLTMLVKTMLALGFALGLLLLRKRPWLAVPYGLAAIVAVVSFAEYGKENIRRQYEIYIQSPQSVRREGYRIAGEIVRDAPIVGLGPGSFGGFAATVLDSPVPTQYGFINYDQQIYTTIDAHWPHLVAEIGLLGLLAYGALLWRMARASWKVSLDPQASLYQRTLALAAAFFLLVVVAEAFAAGNFEDTLCGFLTFTLLGFTQRTCVGHDIEKTRI